jgi:thermitase
VFFMLKRFVAIVALVPLTFSFISTASAKQELTTQTEVASNEIIVKFKENISKSKLALIHKKVDGKVVKKGKNFDVVKVNDGDISKIIESYQENSEVEYAEPNYVYRASYTPDDSYFSSYQYAPQIVGAEQAWDVTQGSSNVKVAIIDTGVDYNHPELVGKVVKGYDFVDDDSDPMDLNFHGTHSAGIAAAITNNHIGIAGIAPNVTILAERVLDASGNGTLDDIANGIIHAADSGAKVISLSLGGPNSAKTLNNAINYATKKGIVVVAAAGNEGTSARTYPAYYSNVIAVAATDSNDQLASFSNYGSWVDVAAPGVSIYSTIPSGGYKYLSGTSMATPLVAGAAGLLASQGKSSVEIRSSLENTADKISGTGTYFRYGRINVAKAVLQ